jgi:hypothetical protein
MKVRRSQKLRRIPRVRRLLKKRKKKLRLNQRISLATLSSTKIS